MKNLTTFCLGALLLIFGGLACSNPLAKYTKQYNCSIPGEPEPQTSDDYVKRGAKHYELNNYSDQFDQCTFDAAQEALRLDPKNANAYALRGTMYRTRREYEEALADFNEALRLAPENTVYYIYRSAVYERKNMLREAIDDYTKGMKDSQRHYDYAKRADLYFRHDELENALKDYTEAIRLKPDEEAYYARRAEIYRKLGRTSEADADELRTRDIEGKIVELSDQPTNGKPVPKTISGGVVNGKASNLVKPPYPPAAKAVRASGAVNVQVTIDEKGNVISASAVSGHPLLRAAAVQAARSSKFNPTMLSGTPVRVTGIIVYNFTPE